MTFCFLDTNILLRMFNKSDPAFTVVRNLLIQLERRGVQPATSNQCLREFWSVSTRPASLRGGQGLLPAATGRRVRYLLRRIQLLTSSARTDAIWLDLVDRYAVAGVNAHDAYIVATMNSHQVRELATFNAQDFQRFASEVALVDLQTGVAAPPNGA